MPASLQEDGAAVLQKQAVQPQAREEGRRQLQQQQHHYRKEVVAAHPCQMEVRVACTG